MNAGSISVTRRSRFGGTGSAHCLHPRSGRNAPLHIDTNRNGAGIWMKFLRNTMKQYGRPLVVVTDRLRSYGAAMKVIGNADRQETGLWLNNRAENSYQQFRRRERAMTKFRNAKSLQKFATHTRQSTIISTWNAIFTADKTLSTTDLSPWQSGGNLQPEIRQYRAQSVL